MGTGVEHFAERVQAASGGSLIIKIYPKETLVPALAVFDAASTGEIDIFHSGPYYWKGKNSAFALFSGTPFGLTSEEINSWMLLSIILKLIKIGSTKVQDEPVWTQDTGSVKYAG
jgi:TRAP-type mannitol/chloroaromatic compound transport system substrate-binding protein